MKHAVIAIAITLLHTYNPKQIKCEEFQGVEVDCLGFGVKFKNGELNFKFEEVNEVVIERQERVRGRRLRRARVLMGRME
ncbi:hypothetical protein VNO80_10441 [Phaseolus coccineus]|uniref:Uncharacterized protein n=1 Tax=Phaseolus coccineus TaxID=3886 RepID=A0AAN9N8N7_PHACN